MANHTPLVEAWIRYAEEDGKTARSLQALGGMGEAFAFTCSNASRSCSRLS